MFLKIFCCVLAVVSFYSVPIATHAYLDPGSGSFIVQMLVASAAGIVYMVRAYIARMFYFIKYKILRQSKNTDEAVLDVVDSDETC